MRQLVTDLAQKLLFPMKMLSLSYQKVAVLYSWPLVQQVELVRSIFPSSLKLVQPVLLYSLQAVVSLVSVVRLV